MKHVAQDDDCSYKCCKAFNDMLFVVVVGYFVFEEGVERLAADYHEVDMQWYRNPAGFHEHQAGIQGN